MVGIRLTALTLFSLLKLSREHASIAGEKVTGHEAALRRADWKLFNPVAAVMKRESLQKADPAPRQPTANIRESRSPW